MNRQDDSEFEDALQQTIHQHVQPLVFSESMRDSVLAAAKRKEEMAKGRSCVGFGKLGRQLYRRRWMAGGLGVVVSILLLFMLAQRDFAPSARIKNGQRFETLQETVGNGLLASLKDTGSVQVAASLAPIESRGIQVLRLRPGDPQVAAGSSVDNSALQVPSGRAGASQNGVTSIPFAYTPQSKTGAIAPSPFAVKTLLYNSSDRPVNGQDLQGMLFILRKQVGLTPLHDNDWEYFVNGPDVVIPPHRAVSWSFTPNPVPPYSTLVDRYAHLIWVFRRPVPNYPTLYMGTLPIQVRVAKVDVLRTGANHVQFLRIIAQVRNLSAAPWSVNSALAMLFFQNGAGNALLGRGTYKYFDDITPVTGTPNVLPAGGRGQVAFWIGGVPEQDMTKLPMTILLVARNQVGA